MTTDILLLCLTGLFTVLWYLLRQKDAKQESEINNLYKLHHEDENKLHELELEIARNHYPKHELDARFSQLDATIRSGFSALSGDIKEMTKALQDHLQRHHGQ